MSKTRAIISLDVEATGDSPETSSCVMIGVVAMLDNVDPETCDYVISKKQWCLEEMTDKPINDRCWNEFWTQNMNVWNHIQQNKQPVTTVMKEFAEWYADLEKKYEGLKFVMKPSSYDWQWINGLYDKYGPPSKPTLSHSGICLSTMFRVMDMFKIKRGDVYNKVGCPNIDHTHFADDDAHEQGYSFLKLKWLIKSQKHDSVINLFQDYTSL